MPRQARLDTPGTLHHVIVNIIQEICDEREVNIKELSSGIRRRFVSEVRRIIACRLVKEYGKALLISPLRAWLSRESRKARAL